MDFSVITNAIFGSFIIYSSKRRHEISQFSIMEPDGQSIESTLVCLPTLQRVAGSHSIKKIPSSSPNTLVWE